MQVLGLLESGASREGARDDLHRSFQSFQARNTKCFVSADHERLLGVIEAGFGRLRDFDLLVRHMLSTRYGSMSSLAAEAHSMRITDGDLEVVSES